ncbi:Dynactin, subunit p62 [Phaffia rhodozyma]|uniref:Dynactin subunit 4 n=1 Tax=Phaffia rhodozyma TaxID=264483 RepID=A0A0F7SSP0_PHARH|nr:Dynactin, subunit p62 [Phaffia rhodozyma]
MLALISIRPALSNSSIVSYTVPSTSVALFLASPLHSTSPANQKTKKRVIADAPLAVNASKPAATDPAASKDSSSETSKEPYYYLSCNHCRFSSAENGITFEKPTGVALQLQRLEDASPAVLEFEHLRDHYEPHLKALSASSHPATATTNKSLLAATSALRRDVPSLRTASSTSRSSRQPAPKFGIEDLRPYEARMDADLPADQIGSGRLGEPELVDWLGAKDSLCDVVGLEARWTNSWRQPVQTSDLKPLRIPLRSKKTKRCSACRHILIKPDQKAQSTRFKIKLLAASYIPTVEVSRKIGGGRSASKLGVRPGRASMTAESSSTSGAGAGTSAIVGSDNELHRGGNYAFHLAFTNPLFDPIQVHLEVIHPSFPSPRSSSSDSSSQPYISPYLISLPISTFPVSAFIDPWEYGAEDSSSSGSDEVDRILDRNVLGGEESEASRRKRSSLQRSGLIARDREREKGFIWKKGNMTKVGLDVQLGQDVVGDIDFTLRVTFTYQSEDDLSTEPDHPKSTSRPTTSSLHDQETQDIEQDPGLKTFMFDTRIHLGRVLV